MFRRGPRYRGCRKERRRLSRRRVVSDDVLGGTFTINTTVGPCVRSLRCLLDLFALCIPELHAVEDLPLDVKPGIVSSVRRVNLVDVCRLPINRGERLRLLGHRRFLHRFEYLRP